MGLAGLESRPEDENLDFESLVDLADRSMYMAKENKGSQISVSMHEKPKFLP